MLSTERPINCVSRWRKASCRRANSTISVVQTGVKSAGCEKSTIHFPSKSESLISPWVLVAVKSGAGSFRPMAMVGFLLFWGWSATREGLRSRGIHAQALRQAQFCRVQVFAALLLRFLRLDFQGMGSGIGILADAGHLPAHFHAGPASGDLEAVVGYLLGNIKIGGGGADRRQMVTEVFVESLAPAGKLDPCLASFVQEGVAAVDIDHLIALDAGVDQVLVGRVERMVYLEVLHAGGDAVCVNIACGNGVRVGRAIDLQAAGKKAGGRVGDIDVPAEVTSPERSGGINTIVSTEEIPAIAGVALAIHPSAAALGKERAAIAVASRAGAFHAVAAAALAMHACGAAALSNRSIPAHALAQYSPAAAAGIEVAGDAAAGVGDGKGSTGIGAA